MQEYQVDRGRSVADLPRNMLKIPASGGEVDKLLRDVDSH
jgi:hypothetical protein